MLKLNTKEFKTEVKKIFDSIFKIHHIKIQEGKKYTIKSIFIIYGLYSINTVELKLHKSRFKTFYQVYSINGTIELSLINDLNELLKTL